MENRFSETRRPTIADIARRAGVTKSSVSFALNGRHGVSEETRRRILEIARELGWQRSSAASALSHGRAGAVGLVLDRPVPGDEASVMRFVSGVERELSKHAVPLLLRLVDDPQDHLTTLGEWWAQRRVDGVILTALTTDDPRPAALREMGLPAITTDPPNQARHTPRAFHPEQPQPTDPTTQVRTVNAEAAPLSGEMTGTEAEGPSARTTGTEGEGGSGRLACGEAAGPSARMTGTEAVGPSERTTGMESEGRRGGLADGNTAGPPGGMASTEAAGPSGGTMGTESEGRPVRMTGEEASGLAEGMGSAVAEGASGSVTFSVGEDEEAAMKGVLAYLAALGHREVARVAGDARLTRTAARDAGLAGTAARDAGLAGTAARDTRLARTTARDAGLARTAISDTDGPHTRIIHTDGTPDQATTATRRLLSAPQPPTAIIYDTDVMAVAGLAVAREMGVEVPADLSIVAWGDTTLAKLSHPPLTVVAADPEALGTRAAKLLLAVIAGQRPTQLPPRVPELIPRGTTSRLEKNRFTS